MRVEAWGSVCSITVREDIRYRKFRYQTFFLQPRGLCSASHRRERPLGPIGSCGRRAGERAEDHARQGRSERGVLRTQASEDAASRRSSGPSPAIMGEGLIGLGHAVDVVLALIGAALLGLGV